jgi:hypothetical protein
MPEYHQIEACLKLESMHDFPVLIKKFENVLSKIGLINGDVKHWLQNISWDILQDGFVYFPDVSGVKLDMDEVSLTVRPSILGITPFILPELKNNWVSIELLIPSAEIDDLSNIPIVHYQENPIKVILEIIQIAAIEFPKSPIFLTNEAQDSQPWLGEIQNNNEKLWFFEIGNVPSTFQKMIVESNEQFHIWKENQRTWFANKQVFPDPPWN